MKKVEPVVVNEGYTQFLSRYESDMKHLEGIVKELETSYQKVVKGRVEMEWLEPDCKWRGTSKEDNWIIRRE